MDMMCYIRAIWSSIDSTYVRDTVDMMCYIRAIWSTDYN